MIGYSPLQIGIVFALSPLMRFLIPFLFLKHITLTKKVFHISLILVFISTLLFYITIQNFYLFMIPNLVIGGAFGLILPYVETYAMELLKKERFGKSRLFGSIGFIVVGLLLATKLDTYVIGLHYYLFFVVLVILFGLLLTYKNKDFQSKEKLSKEKFDITKVTYLWISLFFMQVSFGPFYNFFTIYETQRGISLETVSYLWSFGVICEILFFYFQGPLLKWNLLKILKIAVFITLIRWLLLFFFPSSLTISFISQSLHAISFALHHTVAISILYSSYQNKRLAAQFYYGFSFGLGGFAGALLAGYFYGDYLYLYAAFMSLLSFLALFKIKELRQNF